MSTIFLRNLNFFSSLIENPLTLLYNRNYKAIQKGVNIMEETFGKRLQKALNEKGWKQVDLANATGFSKARISQWVHNKYIPNAEGLNLIAETLGVSETWLMGHDTPKTYDRKKLEMQYEVCDLFQKCYGQEAYSAVSMFLKLDEIDRSKVIERIQTLLESEKYAIKKESSNA